MEVSSVGFSLRRKMLKTQGRGEEALAAWVMFLEFGAKYEERQHVQAKRMQLSPRYHVGAG